MKYSHTSFIHIFFFYNFKCSLEPSFLKQNLGMYYSKG